MAWLGNEGPQLLLGFPEAVLSAPQQHDPRGAEGCHLAGQFRADGAAAAGDEDHRVLDGLPQRGLVQGDGIPAEQVLDGHVLDLGLPVLVPQEIKEGRDGLHGHAQVRQGLGEGADARSRRGGDGQDDVGDAETPDQAGQVLGPAQDGRAVDLDGPLLGGVVHEAHDPVTQFGVPEDLQQDQVPRVAGAEDEGVHGRLGGMLLDELDRAPHVIEFGDGAAEDDPEDASDTAGENKNIILNDFFVPEFKTGQDAGYQD